MRNNFIIKLVFSCSGMAVSITIYYMLNRTVKFQEFSYHFGIIFLSLSVWFSFPDFVSGTYNENFFFNPTHLVLAIIVVSSLLFSYKEVLIYSFFAILNHDLFYLIAGVPFIIIMQKAIMLMIFLGIISFRSYFYYKKLSNLNEKSIEINLQKRKFLSNSELINNFLLSATSNLTIPIDNFENKLADFKQNFNQEIIEKNDEYFDSIYSNFNYMKSLMITINDVKKYSSMNLDFISEETNIEDIVFNFTSQFRNISSNQNILLVINNEINEKININGEIILQILINLTKLKLNQFNTNLNIKFSVINDGKKDFLSIKMWEIVNKSLNSKELDFNNNINNKKENVSNSFEISLIILNLLISKVNGRLFTDSTNEFNIQIPITVKV